MSAGERTDVLVVGGGPAGLLTAIAARLAGLETTVIDRAAPPIDKPCGEGLMPDAVACLRRLGVELDAQASCLFRGIRYLDGDVVAEGRFPGEPGRGVRRLALHAALVRRAEEVGVRLEWHRRVDRVDRAGDVVRGVETTRVGGSAVSPPTEAGAAGRVETAGHGDGSPAAGTADVDHGTFAARWVVAADGLRSPLRREAGLQGRGEPKKTRRFGVRRHFAVAPWSDCVEVYWADDREAYVTPVAADEVGVAILWRGGCGRFDGQLPVFPALAERLRGAEVRSRDRGCGPLRQRVRGVVRGNLALVGDAAGYVDAITGEGLAVACHQAEALAAALAAGDLRRYARAHRRIVALPERLTRVVLFLEARPRLRHRAIRALAQTPATFDRLLAVHARARPPSSLGWPEARLLWRVLQPG